MTQTEERETYPALQVAEYNHGVKKLLELYPSVKVLRDAVADLGILIEQRDIDAAEPGNPNNCAWALATCRTMPEVEGALVGRTQGFIIYGQIAERYVLGKFAQVAISVFDVAGVMKPGLLTFSRVPASQSLSAMRARSNKTEAQRRLQKPADQLAKQNQRIRAHKQEHIHTAIHTRGFRTWSRATRQLPVSIPA